MYYYIEGQSNDPTYNLAMEEYFFRKPPASGNYFLLWQNDNAVIIGKYQNTVEEINAAFVKEHDIRVVRRITGGGAVYHDLGNLNYSLIGDCGNQKELDLRVLSQPVVETLRALGVAAEFNGRNDIVIEGKKFSGGAQVMQNGRLLHHGTLLFDSDLDMIQSALQVKESKIISKSVKSVRSRVTNIAEHLPEAMTLKEFWAALRNNIFAGGELIPYQLTKEDQEAIDRLRLEKYATWDWNYGFSPAYDLKREEKFPCGLVTIYMQVRQGCITGIKIYGDFFGTKDISELEEALTGLKIEERAIAAVLDKLDIGSYIKGLEAEQLTGLILNA